MSTLISEIFAMSPGIRYVAIYQKGRLESSQRGDLEHASSGESDKYEELIVNPTLVKLVTQRGNIDCGGASYVIIRYGYFFELVVPCGDGHYSVGISPDTHPLPIAEAIVKRCSQSQTG